MLHGQILTSLLKFCCLAQKMIRDAMEDMLYLLSNGCTITILLMRLAQTIELEATIMVFNVHQYKSAKIAILMKNALSLTHTMSTE